MKLNERQLLEYAVGSTLRFRVHPLGFYFLVRQSETYTAQRVHVWLSPVNNASSNDIHVHSYDIESSVVLGTLHNELFEFEGDMRGAMLEFYVSYKDGWSSLELTGRRGTISSVATFDTKVGNRYYLRAGRIHRAFPTTIPSVTVLNTRERGLPIYSYGSGPPSGPFPRRYVEEAESNGIEVALLNAVRLLGDGGV